MKPSIEFNHVSKRYRLGRMFPGFPALLGLTRKAPSEKYHWAIRDVNFSLAPGQSLGIIGPNGAGKTTILKLLSRVTYPTYGQIRVSGRFSALIELGAGFHPDLTGRENIYLNGTILGMRRSEIKARFDQIVEFADIGKYLDTPVKRYSSGMYARLGFAVAAHVDPEVLLVDEVLAVGDMAFRRKCYERMLQLIQQGTTLVFVSHDFSAVQKVCSRCLVMYRGNLAFDGAAADATAEYSNILRKAAESGDHAQTPESGGLSQMVMTHAAVIEAVQLLHENGQPGLVFASGEIMRVRLRVRFREHAPSPIFACTLRLPDGQIIYDFTTHWAEQSTPDFPADTIGIVEYRLKLNLVSGNYSIGVDLAYADLSRYYDRQVRAMDFVVTGGNGSRGVANLEARIDIVEICDQRQAGNSEG